MSVSVGDKVQIRYGAKDVTNGKRANKGFMYVEGGPNIATVEAIVKGWNTGGRYGLPTSVTKVRCVDKGVVVWQVQPQDLVVKVSNKKENTKPKPKPKQPTTPTRKPSFKKASDLNKNVSYANEGIDSSNKPYAIVKGSQSWASGTSSVQNNNLIGKPFYQYENTSLRNSNFINSNTNMSYIKLNSLTKFQKSKTGAKNLKIDDSVYYLKFSNLWFDANKRNEMLNLKKDMIQNQYGFPFFKGQRNKDLPAQYDYQIILDDNRFDKNLKLADRLMQARTEFGIPVHGNNQIAKSMKYYMYNRYHNPDSNMLHSKSVTYVFFTRPDLNLLKKTSQGYTANEMIQNHTEAAMVWRRQPEIFKMLTDKTHCGDSNNFNMLLSNQVQSFDIQDEQLSTANVGKNWNEYEMVYGDAYSGRTAGTFTCEFNDTSQYEIINLLKLWITYIDNVSRGAWSPSYNLNGLNRNSVASSHVHTKTLDYPASVYIFKCGPDGEDVLYWSKYYGVFPTNTGANALSWNNSSGIGDSLKLNITFAYSYKRDLSPISLIEFNDIASVDNTNGIYEPSYNVNLAHSSRPYVSTPYIEIDLGSPQLASNDVDRVSKRTQIRLKFRKDTKSSRSDTVLFKSH